ncbi:MAG TPA: 2OG-Fe(II) oxygenase [Candidatus Paceibacterota bacterium]|nr:2OG-Fe(II) oxygenase [Candidatus Paceibacterota bacterium]
MNPFRLTKPLADPMIPIPRGLQGVPLVPDMAEPVEDAAATEAAEQGKREPAMPPDDTPPNLHREILIAPNFLTPDICREYVDYARAQPEIDLSVFDADATNKKGEISWEVDKKTRDTQTVNIEPIKQVVLDLMRYAVRDFLNPFFNVQIKDSEMPQFLIYHPGGHYRPHIDGEALFNDGSGKLSWRRNVDRDISLVVYLNQDFEGGDIVFPKQAITIKPRAGMLLAFPSSHHFLHGVNPVLSGTRYAIVNWFSLGKPADK